MKLKSGRWQASALAAAGALTLGLAAPDAWALALGRISVQSALGEPLRAEIEVLEISQDEFNSLRVGVASPEAFKSSGFDYNPALSNVLGSLQRRTDGRAFVRLSGERSVQDPFLDIVVDAQWASGRLMRDYTLLLDPPSMRVAPAPAPGTSQLPATSPSTAPSTAPTRSGAGQPAATPRTAAASAGVAASPRRPSVAAPAQPASSPASVVVRSGDTAGRIALRYKPTDVSLDQMLVALLRTNPGAFVDQNIHRVKAGAVMNLPAHEAIASVSPSEASQLIVAQSRDFNEFRSKLAGAAPLTQSAAPNRSASGSVQARVEDKRPAAATPDKLTLSKGSVQAQAVDKVAQERSAKENASRASELNRNIADLKQLSAASKAVTTPAQAGAAAGKGSAAALPVAGLTSPLASTPVLPTSAPASAPAAQARASAPSATATPSAALPSAAASGARAPASVPKAAVPVAPEANLLDELLDNPLLPGGAVALLALLGAFAFYRSRQKHKDHVDSSFLDSKLRPDSFFGGSGGQSVDTNNSPISNSSVVPSQSQLDGIDDVDPVAEADVYLAYGRDLQAEEILRDALRVSPNRLAIHHKLAEIFSKRRDVRSFEDIAIQAHKVTGGSGPDWERFCENGIALDPTNPLYQPGGQPQHSFSGVSNPVPLPPNVAEFTHSKPAGADPGDTQPQPRLEIEPQAIPTDTVDLDLDFSEEDAPTSTITEAEPSDAAPLAGASATATPELSLDFDLAEDGGPITEPGVDLDDAPTTSPGDLHALPATPGFGFKAQAAQAFGATSLAPLPEIPAATGLAPASPGATDGNAIEFDLGSLSLDLGDLKMTSSGAGASDPSPDGPSTAAAPLEDEPLQLDTGEARNSRPAALEALEPDDPLLTKLALAEEFKSIGDADGARALIEEVLSEATGDVKARAQAALNKL